MRAAAKTERSSLLPSVSFVAKTDKGNQRTHNEDAWDFRETAGLSIYVVADGVGGADRGDEASTLAVEAFCEALLQEQLNEQVIDPDCITRAVRHAHEVVCNRAKTLHSIRGIGTTLTSLIVAPTGVFVVNVGDSRAYRLRSGTLELLTHDHTVVDELVRDGLLSPKAARTHPAAHVLTRALGFEKHVEAECRRIADTILPGERYLLATDGLSCTSTDEEVARILKKGTLEQVTSGLINLANRRGGPDNTTVIALEGLGYAPNHLANKGTPAIQPLIQLVPRTDIPSKKSHRVRPQTEPVITPQYLFRPGVVKEKSNSVLLHRSPDSVNSAPQFSFVALLSVVVIGMLLGMGFISFLANGSQMTPVRNYQPGEPLTSEGNDLSLNRMKEVDRKLEELRKSLGVR